MPAASEVPPDMKPRPTKTVEIMEFKSAAASLQKVDPRIPPEITKKAVHLLFSTNLLPDIDLEKPYIIELPSTNMLALILPLPDSSHFQMPPPFKNHQNHTGRRSEPPRQFFWKVRSDQQTGLTIKTIPDVICPPLELFTSAERFQIATPFLIGRPKNLWIPSRRKGKDNKTSSSGQMAQLSVAEKGVATTSEKYTIAHSKHVGLKFVALKWQNLPQAIDADDSSTDDCNYRSINERTKDHQPGRWDYYRP